MRIDSQIRAAKRKAVGGKKDRCRKGKSCSATCISGWKACLVEMTASVSGSLTRTKKTVQKRAGQILPGKREKYLESKKEKFISVRKSLIAKVQRADLKGDQKKGSELRRRLNRLEEGIGAKLKVPAVKEVSTKTTDERRAKYNSFKSSLAEEMKRLAISNKKGSYDRIEERLMRLQSKAGSKFGDKDMIEKGKIWKDAQDKRFFSRQTSFAKAQKGLLKSLEDAAKRGDVETYNRIENALLKSYRGEVAKRYNLSLEKGSVWEKFAPKGSKGEVNVSSTLKESPKKAGESKPNIGVKSVKVAESSPKSEEESFRRFLADHDRLSKTPPKLDKLATTEDFDRKKLDTKGVFNDDIKMYNSWFTSVLKPAVEYEGTFGNGPKDKFFERLFNSVEAGMGGRRQLDKAIFNVEDFTGGAYKRIRDAQLGRGGNKEEGNSIEKLLSRKELLRPPVEKFRGVTVDTDVLNSMIASAKAGGTYSGRALSSWSTDLGVGQFFADIKSGRPEKVIYRTVNVHGVPITGVSQTKSESELLTPGNANYRYLRHTVVRAIDKDGKESTYNIFDVEEF